MDQELETQLMKILNKISSAERTRNRALQRQTVRLIQALFYMKAILTSPRALVLAKG